MMEQEEPQNPNHILTHYMPPSRDDWKYTCLKCGGYVPADDYNKTCFSCIFPYRERGESLEDFERRQRMLEKPFESECDFQNSRYDCEAMKYNN